MGGFLLHACVPCTAWCLLRSEENVGIPGTGVTDVWELPCGCWEPNLGPLQVLFTTEHFSIPSYVVLKCELCRQMIASQQSAYSQQSGIFVIKSTWNESRKHSRTYSIPDGPCLHTPGFCCWCFGRHFDAGSDPVAQMGLDFMMNLLSQPLKYWDWRCVPLVLLLYLVPSLPVGEFVCVCVSDY